MSNPQAQPQNAMGAALAALSSSGSLTDEQIKVKLSEIHGRAAKKQKTRNSRGWWWNLSHKLMIGFAASYGIIAGGTILLNAGIQGVWAGWLLLIGGLASALAEALDARGRAASNLMSREEWRQIMEAADLASQLDYNGGLDERRQLLHRLQDWERDRQNRDTESRLENRAA